MIPPEGAQTPPLTPAAQAALEKLADVAVPAPVPWTPQTWGWVALAVLLGALATWLVVRTMRRRRANRYRVEALAELGALEARLADASERTAALQAISPLLKRVALAAWPRADVAALSGVAWVAFLRQHAGRSGFPDEAAHLLADGEYRPDALARLSAADARRVAAYVREWIEGHRVHP